MGRLWREREEREEKEEEKGDLDFEFIALLSAVETSQPRRPLEVSVDCLPTSYSVFAPTRCA